MRAFAAVLALVVLAAAAPALADVTQGDLEEAREQVRRVTERLADEVASYDAAVSQEAALLDRLDQLFVELTARDVVRHRIVASIVEAYARFESERQ